MRHPPARSAARRIPPLLGALAALALLAGALAGSLAGSLAAAPAKRHRPPAGFAVPSASPAAVRAMDTLLAAAYPPDQPGAAVLVMKGGRTLLRKGYGLANLELGVKVAPEMVFRLGSITKQFTAVALLQLVDQGRLALGDTLGKFLPGYPSRGRTITLEHLLTHTSGIRSYTEMPEWFGLWRKDMTPGELIDLFKNQPMDFAPGEDWSYDNSGYVLLGAVIEKVSGERYQDYLRRHLFEPLGMTHTCYDSTEAVIPGRVAGYEKGPSGWLNAPYLSMTQPYAAGSLLSSVDDLATWYAALDTDRLLPRTLLSRAYTPSILADGRATGYGYGWFIAQYQGHPTIEHGGGVNGFTTYALRVPDERVLVVVLSNAAGGPEPGSLALRLAGLALGNPRREPLAVVVPRGELERLTGVYGTGSKARRMITLEGDQLYSQRVGGTRTPVFALSPTEFYFKGSDAHLLFDLGPEGPARKVEVRGRLGPPEIAPRQDDPLPAARAAVTLDSTVLARYPGQYQLAPGFVLTVTLDHGRLTAQATGQSSFEIFPESETRFFVKVVDATIDFVMGRGPVAESLVLHQGGRDMPAKRLP